MNFLTHALKLINSFLNILYLLQLILLALWVTNLINWTWWRVVTPLFICWSILFIMTIIAGILYFISEMEVTNMAKENSSSRGGLTFIGAIQIALIVLKLCGVITCSWFVILLPAFIVIGIPLLCLVAALTFALITGIRIRG